MTTNMAANEKYSGYCPYYCCAYIKYIDAYVCKGWSVYHIFQG